MRPLTAILLSISISSSFSFLPLLWSGLFLSATAFALPSSPFASRDASSIPAQVFMGCTVPGTAALTFNDGPHVFLPNISDALHNAGAKGTFFFNGVNFGHCIYDPDQVQRVQYAFNQGHQIASHTWNNGNLTNLSFDDLHNHFWLVEEAILKITGAYPAWARPPNGQFNDLVRQVSGSRGQNLALWDFDAGDAWKNMTFDGVNKRYDDLVDECPDSVLAVNHELFQTTAFNVVPHAIQVLQEAGYELVTLAECLGMEPYQGVVGKPQLRDATWTCAGKPEQVNPL